MVQDDAVRLGLEANGRLHGVAIRQHAALAKPLGHEDVGQSEFGPSAVHGHRFHPLAVGQRIVAVPRQQRVHGAIAVVRHDPIVIQASVPSVVAKHAVVFGVTSLVFVFQRHPVVAQLFLRIRTDHPSAIALGPVVHLHVPREDQQTVVRFTEINQGLVPFGPIHLQNGSCLEGFDPERFQLGMQCQPVRFVARGTQAGVGRLHTGQFRRLSPQGREEKAGHPAHGQPMHATRLHH